MVKGYEVLQGQDEWLGVDSEFTNKKDALKRFNAIKKDTKGWTGKVLITAISVSDSDDYIEYHEEKIRK